MNLLRLALRRNLSKWQPMLFVIIGLVITIALITSVPLFTDGALDRFLRNELAIQREGRPVASLLLEHRVPFNASTTLEQYDQADRFVRQNATALTGLPLLRMTRYGSTRVTKILATEDKDLPEDLRQYQSAGLAFLTGLEDHVEIVLGEGFAEDQDQDNQGLDGLLSSPKGRGLSQRLTKSLSNSTQTPPFGGLGGLLNHHRKPTFNFLNSFQLWNIDASVAYASAAPPHQSTPETRIQSNAPIEVLVSERFFYDHDIQIGDRFLYGEGDPKIGTPVEVLIKGVWRPTNTDRSFWFEEPEAFAFYFMIPEQPFMARVAPTVVEQIRVYTWYLFFDVDQIKVAGVGRILSGIQHIQARMSGILSRVDLTTPVFEILETYALRSAALRTFLLLLSTPVLITLLLYIFITANIMVTSEENEIVIFKSRGATNAQIIGLYFLEILLMAILGLGVGLILASGIAQGMGQIYRFLTIAVRPLLDLSFSAQVGIYAGLTTVLTIGATLLPATRVARRTIIAQQRKVAREAEFSRARRKAYLPLELIFIVGALYGYWRLRQQEQTYQLIQDTFVDPLFLLAPTIFAVAMILVTLRLLPHLLALMTWIISRFSNPALWLAINQISRQTHTYRLLLFLLIFTVTTGFFSATFASTLDTHFTDVVRYEVGTDLVIEVQWEQVEGSSVRWRFPPFTVVHSVLGVQDATRVLRLQGFVDGLQGNVETTVLGIDRADFGLASWWRDDFARESLGTLMNSLALNGSGVLVSRGFIAETGLQVGDELFLIVGGISQPIRLTIAGILDYFPTLFPEEGHFFVANLDHIYRTIGNQPYDIWVKLANNASPASVLETLRERGFIITGAIDSRWKAAVWRTDPQRTALFGILSLGFMVAILISGLGFLLHALFSLRQRIVQFGTLRAMGLSTTQITAIVIFEKLFLVILGTLSGTIIGLLTSSLFIPLLQLGTAVQGTTPPFVVAPAWGPVTNIYLAFGGMVIITLSILIWQLRRLRIYEAIKLGILE